MWALSAWSTPYTPSPPPPHTHTMDRSAVRTSPGGSLRGPSTCWLAQGLFQEDTPSPPSTVALLGPQRQVCGGGQTHPLPDASSYPPSHGLHILTPSHARSGRWGACHGKALRGRAGALLSDTGRGAPPGRGWAASRIPPASPAPRLRERAPGKCTGNEGLGRFVAEETWE